MTEVAKLSLDLPTATHGKKTLARDIYKTPVGEKGQLFIERKGCTELLPAQQGEAEMERPDESG